MEDGKLVVTSQGSTSAIIIDQYRSGAPPSSRRWTQSHLAVSKENLTAAGSRIRDTDLAEEMDKHTHANIRFQAGTAMLAQANQSNSRVLQLLQ